jgi:hypothetical protein
MKPGDMAHDDKWLVGYYTLEANYNAGAAGGVWIAPGGGGQQPTHPPVVSTWQFLSEHDSEEAAIDRVNFLNGGAVML